MKSYMQKKEEVVRSWYVIDAADQNLGRVATKAAHILRGKNKVTYTPNSDTPYDIEYYKKDLGATTYTKAETENKSGTTNATVELKEADLADKYEMFRDYATVLLCLIVITIPGLLIFCKQLLQKTIK